MAKKQYASGIVVISSWLNSIFGIGADGGHRHDGEDADGHCGKINLNNGTDVSGVLPANMCAASLPVGLVFPFCGLTSPVGFLVCNGASFDVTTYPALNALLGGNTLPDLRGRFIVGSGGGFVPGTTGGESEHVLTSSEMPSHQHLIGKRGADNSTQNLFDNGTLTSVVGSSSFSDFAGNTGGGEQTTRNTTLTGGGNAHNNLPPYFVLVWIIKAL